MGTVLTGRVAHTLDAGDRKVQRRVNEWRPPLWIRVWMLCATRGGDGWLWYFAGALVAVFGGPRRFQALASAGLAVGTGIVVFLKLKKRVGRARPCESQPHCWSKVLPPDRFSFPSGHTITAFAVSTALSRYYPDFQAALIFCACSIALSRVILGMHYVSDVIAGALLGYSIARISQYAVASIAA